jgi:hypothetical protein
LSSATKASGHAFQRLLVRREFDVGAEFVRRKGREGDPRLEGAAVEMRIFAGALEQSAMRRKSAASAMEAPASRTNAML